MEVKKIAKTILCHTGNEGWGEERDDKKEKRFHWHSCEEERPEQMLN